MSRSRALAPLAIRLAPVAALLAACSSSPPPPAEAPAPSAQASAEASAAPAPEEKPSNKIPDSCESQGKLCLPPKSFVKHLCERGNPDVALAMLAKGTPWSRGYLRVKSAEAWNASGGASSQDKLVFDEEFILLTHRAADTGGMQVSGAGGGYDVLRWDGSCASLSDEEVTTNASPSPQAAKIPWKYLADATQAALLADPKINKVYIDRRKECKGATMGDVSLKCVKLDDQLSKVVVDFVRGGGAIPQPTLP